MVPCGAGSTHSICSHDLSDFVQLFWGPAQSPPLRVNDAVFAFIIYFFRLLFELPALILDQPNNFY